MAKVLKKDMDIYDEYSGKANAIENKTTTSASDDYYKMAREQEYNLLLDKEVALENAKANALKYTQNTINAQGLGSTGYGSSMGAGIYNAYMNRAMQAETDYENNLKNLDYQHKLDVEAKEKENEVVADDDFKSNLTMLQNADSVDTMNSLLAELGYVKTDSKGNALLDSDGNVQWTKPEGMSERDWVQTKYYYGLQKNAFALEANDDDNFSGTYFTDISNLKNLKVTYDEKDGGQDTAKIGSDFDYETDRYWNAISAGRIEYGSVTKLTRDIGNKGSIYLMYTKKGIRLCTEADYNKAENKHEIIGKNGTFK